MSVLFRTRWLKVYRTRRGTRVGVGPSWMREWYGAGGRGVSTGAGLGPFWLGKYFPIRRQRENRGRRR